VRRFGHHSAGADSFVVCALEKHHADAAHARAVEALAVQLGQLLAWLAVPGDCAQLIVVEDDRGAGESGEHS